MDAIATSLFALTAAALKKTTFEIPVPDPERFYQTAREQGLSGTVYPAMPKGTDPVLLSRLRKDFFRFAEQDALQQKMVADLDNVFAEDQIPHLYLKGAYMKGLYPEPWMRSMGDIDILVPEAELKRVGDILVSLGMELKTEATAHDLYVKGKLEVSIHPRIDTRLDLKHQQDLHGLWDRAIPGKGSSLRMTESDTLVYLLAHMARHIKAAGVGVRSILDIGICVDRFRDTLSWKNFLPRLRAADLERLFLTMAWVNERWFAIVPPAGLVFPQEFNEKFLDDFTDYVLSSGRPEIRNEENDNPEEGLPSTSGPFLCQFLRFLRLETFFQKKKALSSTPLYFQRRKWFRKLGL